MSKKELDTEEKELTADELFALKYNLIKAFQSYKQLVEKLKNETN